MAKVEMDLAELKQLENKIETLEALNRQLESTQGKIVLTNVINRVYKKNERLPSRITLDLEGSYYYGTIKQEIIDPQEFFNRYIKSEKIVTTETVNLDNAVSIIEERLSEKYKTDLDKIENSYNTTIKSIEKKYTDKIDENDKELENFKVDNSSVKLNEKITELEQKFQILNKYYTAKCNDYDKLVSTLTLLENRNWFKRLFNIS